MTDLFLVMRRGLYISAALRAAQKEARVGINAIQTMRLVAVSRDRHINAAHRQKYNIAYQTHEDILRGRQSLGQGAKIYDAEAYAATKGLETATNYFSSRHADNIYILRWP